MGALASRRCYEEGRFASEHYDKRSRNAILVRSIVVAKALPQKEQAKGLRSECKLSYIPPGEEFGDAQENGFVVELVKVCAMASFDGSCTSRASFCDHQLSHATSSEQREANCEEGGFRREQKTI